MWWKKFWELTNHITSALNAQRKSAGPHACAMCERSVRIRNTHTFLVQKKTKIKNIVSLNNTVQAGFTEFTPNLEFYVSPFHNCFDIYINDNNNN